MRASSGLLKTSVLSTLGIGAASVAARGEEKCRQRCAAEICLAGKVFWPHMLLPSVRDASAHGLHV